MLYALALFAAANAQVSDPGTLAAAARSTTTAAAVMTAPPSAGPRIKRTHSGPTPHAMRRPELSDHAVSSEFTIRQSLTMQPPSRNVTVFAPPECMLHVTAGASEHQESPDRLVALCGMEGTQCT